MRRVALLVAVAVCLLGAAAGCGRARAGEPGVPGPGNVTAGPGVSPVPLETGVRGRVSTSNGGPLANATVMRLPAEASGPVTQEVGVTDGDGHYFWALPAGVWDIEVSMAGLRTVRQRVTVVEGQWATVDFVLPPA